MAAKNGTNLGGLRSQTGAMPDKMNDGLASSQVIVELLEQGYAAVYEVLLHLDLAPDRGEGPSQVIPIRPELAADARHKDAKGLVHARLAR